MQDQNHFSSGREWSCQNFRLSTLSPLSSSITIGELRHSSAFLWKRRARLLAEGVQAESQMCNQPEAQSCELLQGKKRPGGCQHGMSPWPAAVPVPSSCAQPP